ncbi:MAG: hypothetical protein HUJ75_08365 [Parasporobacterium sp.]|nr:hypothetical protein [Parasporobacterium sp.]
MIYTYAQAEYITKLHKEMLEKQKKVIEAPEKFRASVKLNADPSVLTGERNAEADRVVQNLCKYKTMKELSRRADANIRGKEEPILQYCQDVKRANMLVKYWLLSKLKQAAADVAFNRLDNMAVGEYGDEARDVINGIAKLQLINPAEAWKDYETYPAEYAKLLEEFEAAD